MDRDLFCQACLLLFGHNSTAPAAMRLKVSDRTLLRWKAGDPIPPGVADDLAALCEERMLELGTMAGRLRATAPRSARDPHSICRKWVGRLGSAFDPHKRALDYPQNVRDHDDLVDYDDDMRLLHAVAKSPDECVQMALADAGLDGPRS